MKPGVKLPAFLLFCFLWFSALIYPTEAENTGYFRITFTDKDNSPFTLDAPEEFLSARALERRERSDIQIDITDLPVNPAYIDSIRSAGASIRFDSRWFNYVVAGIKYDATFDRINAYSFVEDITLVKPYLEETDDGDIVGKEDTKLPYAFEPVTPYDMYGDAFLQIDQLNGQYLHERGHKGENKVIAVLDAGYTLVDELNAFSQIRENGSILSNYDFIRGESDVYEDHMHGTYVLSVMAGKLEGKLKGTATEAKYHLLRSEDAASEYRIEELAWIAAAEYADSAGADIINSSLGYTTFDDTTMNYSVDDLDGLTTWVARGADLAFDKGILVVNSAGNYGATDWHKLGSPGDARGVLTVGAITHEKTVADFSSRGYTADDRVKPSVMAMGKNASIASHRDNRVTTGNGTSFSSPLIAGLAASLWSAFPDLSNIEIRDAIVNSTHLRNEPNKDMGYGIPDFAYAYKILKGETIPDPDNFDLITVYPNPFHNTLVIKLYSRSGQDLNVKIYDEAGKLVLSKIKVIDPNTYGEIVLENFSDLNSGLYFLHLQSKNQIEKRKLVRP